MILMSKDIPVLEIENYSCKILKKELLPIALRYDDVTYDDVIHNWAYMRAMDLGKTNAKQIMTVCGLKQHNPYVIAKAFHFATLSDSYWMKEKDEIITWNDVSLFRNPFNKAVSMTAISGELPNIILTGRQRIQTPEPMTRGMAAKTWIRDEFGNVWLCKIGAKELLADQILDVLQIHHLHYEKCSDQEAVELAGETRFANISKNGECIVKSRLMSSEDLAMVLFEDFSIYCDRNNINPYEWMLDHYPQEYAQMQAVDYILANNDRHEENWGLFMDSNSGEIIGFIPLYDHDQILSKDELVSQTIDAIGIPMLDTLPDSAQYLDDTFGSKLAALLQSDVLDQNMRFRIEQVEEIFLDTHNIDQKLNKAVEHFTNQQHFSNTIQKGTER